MSDLFLEVSKKKTRRKKKRSSDIVTREFQYFRRKYHALKSLEEKKEWIKTYLREIEFTYDRNIADKLRKKIKEFLRKESIYLKAKRRAKRKIRLKKVIRRALRDILYNPRMKL
ncbi:MAG TPA: hypothetical protein EYH22_03535 [Candidatus Nanopusillus sp.]|nr:hypothetical protein [Candidatus Nanopusillus sp.]